MKKIILILIPFFICNSAFAKIKIFSCEPELTAIAREIVKDKAKIETALNAKQNPYLKVEKTSALNDKVRSADMVFCSGLGLEDLWLPSLLKHSFNPKIKSKEAILMAFDGIGKKSEERSGSRLHLNPYNVKKVAENFLNFVSNIDVDNAAAYRYYYQNFIKDFDKVIENLEKKATPLKGKKVVMVDDKWCELAKWLGLDIVTTIVDENGKKKNIAELAKILKEEKVEMIIYSDLDDERIIYDLAAKAKVRAVLLPITNGNLVNTSTTALLFNNIVNRLLVDCSKQSCQKDFYSKSLGSYINYDNTTTQQNY